MNPSSIKQWKEDERPREKLLHKGASSLSDAELLAILIGSGTANFSALDAARGVLSLANNQIQQLGRLSVKELMQVKGIGEARAITIAASLELGRRRQEAPEDIKTKLVHSGQMVEVFRPLLQDLNHEVLAVAYLNRSMQLIKREIISQGGLTSTVADVRLILKQAILMQATNIAIAHNHPSGETKPSEADKSMTTKIAEGARLVEITLVEHIIIGGHNYYSFSDNGLL